MVRSQAKMLPSSSVLKVYFQQLLKIEQEVGELLRLHALEFAILSYEHVGIATPLRS